MSRVTIHKDIGKLDPFYRYKRDFVRVEQTCKNGGRTRIVNINSIAHDIFRDSSIIRKYFQKKLNRSISKDFTITGYLSANELDNLIDNLVQEIVLCKVCNNPETDKGVCAACGSTV